jgi:hypothetical protein
MPSDVSLPALSPDTTTFLLRPEFLQTLDTPLSADAFRISAHVTGAAVPLDVTANELDAANATALLINSVVSAFVERLEQQWELNWPVLFFSDAGLTCLMHSCGINMRYLGVIASAATAPWLRTLCEVEMLARAVKVGNTLT